MWRYGRKVIEALFKRRTECPAIRAEFASRSEADSDRSDIRVFEAGLSTEQYGDYEQSTGNAAHEKESNRLIAIAKDNQLFIKKKDWEQFGERKRLPSGESIVYLTDGKKLYFIDPIIKMKRPAVEVLTHYYELLQ